MRTFMILAAVVAMAKSMAAAPSDEIEGLLRYVAGLDGAAFIRNGEAHAPAEAEAHLRMKWKHQASKIDSAEDFVRLCATKSALSGKRYVIKFKDGREEEAGTVLLKQLELIRSRPTADAGRRGGGLGDSGNRQSRRTASDSLCSHDVAHAFTQRNVCDAV